MNDAAVEKLLARHAKTVERQLQLILARRVDDPKRLIESVAYSINAGGKRLRPALVLETFHACAR